MGQKLTIARSTYHCADPTRMQCRSLHMHMMEEFDPVALNAMTTSLSSVTKLTNLEIRVPFISTKWIMSLPDLKCLEIVMQSFRPNHQFCYTSSVLWASTQLTQLAITRIPCLSRELEVRLPHQWVVQCCCALIYF